MSAGLVSVTVAPGKVVHPAEDLAGLCLGPGRARRQKDCHQDDAKDTSR